MKTEQKIWSPGSGWEITIDNNLSVSANLVLVFGNREELESPDRFYEIKEFYPNADVMINSTSGEIYDINVNDSTIVLTAICFEQTELKFARIDTDLEKDSFKAGESISNQLLSEALKHIFVISDGQMVNGSQLVSGMNSILPERISVTGGLAGDGSKFMRTLVGLNQPPSAGQIIAIGFYGESLQIGFGSRGGWDPFGPQRLVTKAENNVLYELDGQSALSLYKKYLGEQAAGLPGTGLLFPLSIQINEDSEFLVRTILAVDEENQSMTFAGDIPVGSKARLMKANFDRLVEGAEIAAEDSKNLLRQNDSELAILVSCVGRKLVLGQRIEEEVEMVREVLGNNTTITGFYSYGEICPTLKDNYCDLHNQTMTITTLSEV